MSGRTRRERFLYSVKHGTMDVKDVIDLPIKISRASLEFDTLVHQVGLLFLNKLTGKYSKLLFLYYSNETQITYRLIERRY